jgi:hypothetical protein
MVKNNAWNFDTTYTIGDLLYASTTSELSKLAIGSNAEVLGSTGTIPEWQTASFPPVDNQNFSFFEDYLGHRENAPAFAQNAFEFEETGSQDTTGFQGHPGVQTLSTKTSSTGKAQLGFTAPVLLLGGGVLTYHTFCKIDTLSTALQRFTISIGLSDADVSTTSNYTNGCWFEYSDNVNSGNWQIKCMQASTVTTANTSTAADTNWHKYSIIVNAAGTSVAFYIDDVQVANSPITTNIPVSAGQGISPNYFLAKSIGTTERVFYVDWYDLTINLTNPRY